MDHYRFPLEVSLSSICSRWRRLFVLSLICLLGGCGSPKKEDGPLPRAVIDNRQIDFGKVIVGATVKHTFKITNEGDAELVLGQPKKSFSNTRYEVTWKLSGSRVPPGQSINVTLTYRLLEPSSKLYAGVQIPTNEAEDAEIQLGGKFEVEEVLVARAEGMISDETGTEWQMKLSPEGMPEDHRGMLCSSKLDKFQITAIESDNPVIRAVSTPLSEKKLEEFGAKSGYEILVQFRNAEELGLFRANLTVKTDTPNRLEKRIVVRGVHWGPLIHFAAPGAKWNRQAAILDLGRFSSQSGKTQTVTLVLKTDDLEMPIQWKEVRTNFRALQASIVADAKRSTATRQWAVLTLTVPENQGPQSHNRLDPVHVEIHTTHPRAKVIRFRVHFTSA
ncbi:MAG: hypothetical protein Tsb009_04940 [Planctomycetaceae bacterium]